MNMFPYTPTQLFTMHSHPQMAHQQQQQAIYAQQQNNMLFYQYNPLQSIQTPYSNSVHTPTIYIQPPVQHQQSYRPDQLVPQTFPHTTTPTQQSNPSHKRPISSPDSWINGALLQNPEVFRSVLHNTSNRNADNSISSAGSTPPAFVPFKSPRLSSRGRYSLDKYHQNRHRLHSRSSCYKSDSSALSSDSEREVERHRTNSKKLAVALSPSTNRSRSIGGVNLSSNEPVANDVHLPPFNKAHAFSPAVSHGTPKSSTKDVFRPKLLQYIAENIIGKDFIFQGPWGRRKMIYCDYTASGRSLQFIENYIKTLVLPLYGNTHSETSFCARQSTKLREEARQIIKKSVNANENDIVLFTGAGSTGAIHTLVDNFHLHNEDIRKNTVVIISAFEHHSNILPWKETGVEMVRIPTTQHGILDRSALETQLQYYSNMKKCIICSLNAASNISGILTDVDDISTLVHSYSGLIFWDYATAAPYIPIDMNPSTTAYKDAIFISTHKFVGGPGTPGILIAKKTLFTLKAPKICGGGTVNFVTRTGHEYNYDIETREEGGTPDIIGCIRAGLVFQLKDSIDHNYLQMREDELVKRFHQRMSKIETLILLGSQTARRLPVFSFIIYVPGVCKYLHHNFVCLLLNDLFGIQVRSGCACAGPYALDLLNVDDAKTDIYCMFMTENVCTRGGDKIVRTMMMKPGFTRLNLSFFANDEEIDYVLDAIQFVATEGWKFLPLYTYNPVTAGWSHRNAAQLTHPSLENISYKSGKMQYDDDEKSPMVGHQERNLSDAFHEARLIAADAVRRAVEAIDYTSDPALNIPEKYQHMVWFAVPIDIALMMMKQKQTGQEPSCDIEGIPFIPSDAKERLVNPRKTNALLDGENRYRRKRSSSRCL